MTKDFCEASLVMIKALFAFIVDTSDIYHDGTGVKDGRISSTLEVYERESQIIMISRDKDKGWTYQHRHTPSCDEGDIRRVLHHNGRYRYAYR